jgi:thiamine pyrophosphokinase
VITGGEGPAPEALREIARGADLLAAADSGLVAAEEAGLSPDWVLGDMDSLDNPARLGKYPSERVIRYPREKDFTDTELALALLKEKGCDEIWLAGGGGGRTDHLFAIFSLFEREPSTERTSVSVASKMRDSPPAPSAETRRTDRRSTSSPPLEPPDRWFTAHEEIRCLKEGRTLDAALPPGSLVSVFPLGSGPWAAESSGLKWPLDGLAWERGGFGLSNVALGGTFRIRSLQGRFMVIGRRGMAPLV